MFSSQSGVQQVGTGTVFAIADGGASAGPPLRLRGMARSRSDLRILLLQIRDLERVRTEELQSFANQAQLDTSQIEVLNVFDTPRFPASAADGYDALWVGGASEASVLEPETYEFVPGCCELLAQRARTKAAGLRVLLWLPARGDRVRW